MIRIKLVFIAIGMTAVGLTASNFLWQIVDRHSFEIAFATTVHQLIALVVVFATVFMLEEIDHK